MELSAKKSAFRVGIVVGEVSGDLLGAQLITALCRYYPNLEIIGIVGPKMLALGAQPLFLMEKLAVMGIGEIFCRLPELLSIRRAVYQYFKKNPIDIFIGIDAPDFNLQLEKKLRPLGIKIVHYVSPSVWAWRQKRLKTIAYACDLVLTLFPFEAKFYEQHNIPVCYVGHPLADSIPAITEQAAARQKLALPLDKKIIALLPGSRSNELHYMAALFIHTAQRCLERNPQLHFVAPMANVLRQAQFSEILNTIAPDLPITLLEGEAQSAMIAADVVLVASGTATLECMLVKRPMVVVYCASRLSLWIARRFLKIKMIALPNLLAGKKIVPEFIQEAAQPEVLAEALMNQLRDNDYQTLIAQFTTLHQQLRCNASQSAAAAIHKLLTDHK